MDSPEGQPIQTIRISDKEKEKLIWAINQTPQYSVGEHPGHLRVTAAHTNAIVTLLDNTSQPMEYAVIAYSHGRKGISVVHGRYIHPSTRCRIRFQSLNGKWHERAGHTGQCIHIQGLIHALLVVFDEPINLDEFALLSPEQETQHLQEIAQELPHLDKEEFAGLISRVLFVDDHASDRKLLNYWLGRSSMQVATVASFEAAVDQLEENSFDLLIVDMHLGDKDGAELIQWARRNRFVQPILAVSAYEHLEERALGAGASHFLPKPLSEQTLVESCKTLLGLDAQNDESPVYSEFSSDQEMVPLLTGFVRSMTTKISEIREANNNNDYESIERIAIALKGCGDGYGFPSITAAATSLLSSLNDGIPDMDEIKRQTNALMFLISRLRVRQTKDEEHA